MSHPITSIQLDPQTIPFSFFDLASGLLFRYPNPLAKHVQCYDVITPFYLNENGELVGKTIVMKTNPIPRLFHSLCTEIGVKYRNKTCIPLVEEYKTNLEKRRVEHLSRNIMSRNYLMTHERSIYDAVRTDGGCVLEDEGVKATVVVRKELAVRTDATEYAYLQNKILNYTVTRWKKNSFKQRNGLCYSLAKNNYCPELAKDFQYAGQVGEKWARAVARLRTLQAQARVTKDYVKSEITNPKNIRTVVRKTPKL